MTDENRTGESSGRLVRAAHVENEKMMMDSFEQVYFFYP
jgi:hypothetical protein